MSIQAVEGDTAVEAWRAGCALLLSSRGEISNLISTISQPCEVDDQWLLRHSPVRYKAGADDARDVANTLFPQKTNERSANREDLYSQYLRAHDRAHTWRRGRNAWGTYFERLIRFPPGGVNQLERAIRKVNTWPQRNTTGLVFHLSSPAIDAPRTRGGPCWQFAEILWNADDSLDLVVVYRNHDFFNKVLGNFVGLGRLLKFICTSTNKQPGKLVCHSVHAYFDCSQQQLRSLIQ
jgi:thymidylate synthase